jgi:putative ABC transport system permease protein
MDLKTVGDPMRDLRYVVRSLAGAPGFAAAVVVTLGLAIGANAAIFSVVRGVILRPLPHRDGDRVMVLRQSAEAARDGNIQFSVPEINDLRESSKTLSGIAEYAWNTVTLEGDKDVIRVDAGVVSGNYLAVMGLSAELGRNLGTGDDGTGAAPVMMLTHEFWEKRFGGDRTIVGRKVRIGGKSVEVVGVLQSAPFYPSRPDVLMNIASNDHDVIAETQMERTHRHSQVFARLAPGSTLAEAGAEVKGISDRARAAHPEAYDRAAGYRVTVTPLKQILGESARSTLWLLSAAALLVLVVACANVTNLALMRTARRAHEFAVRLALGAGIPRLRRMLLTENLLLALMGAALGLAIAYRVVPPLASFAWRYSTRAGEIRVDGAVFAFTLAIAALAAAVLSFAPALASEKLVGASIASGGKWATAGAKRRRLQRALVVAQVAVSVVVLSSAGLLTRTVLQLSAVDTGMNPEHLLTLEVPSDYLGPEYDAKMRAEEERVQTALAAIPGVVAVGLGSSVPLGTRGVVASIKAENHEPGANEPLVKAEYRSASAGYFKTSGIPVLRGREFLATDREGSARVVILNKAIADRLFANEDPLGRRVAWTGEELKFKDISQDWSTVVGVVGNIRDDGLATDPHPEVFTPFDQAAYSTGGFVIRTTGDPSGVAAAAKTVVHDVMPQAPIERVLTAEQLLDENVAPRRLNAILVGFFAILSLILVSIGIVAVLGSSVAERTNEIGIRVSLGASAGQIRGMIATEGGVLIAIGLVLGMAGTLAVARLMQGLLFGVAAYDPLTLAGSVAVLAVAGIGACLIPAARAARVDAITALRAG